MSIGPSGTTGLPPAKRAYDARSRRERAEQERAETRGRVLAAARARFLADGYAGTKMLDIAKEAGVAIASVYRAGRSKAELIEMILELAIAGRDPDESPGKRPTIAALGPPHYPQIEAAASDPEAQVRMIADRITDVLDRIGPLWTVLRDAASVDAGAAATMHAILERRATSYEVGIDLLPRARLRASRRESIDTLWALTSPETYLMLRTTRGWSHRRYRDWLRQTLLLQLLTPTTDRPNRATPPRNSPSGHNRVI